ncbi:MAG TPA: aldehyde dehydrogenase family protein [Nitrososphaerales archaeon]|nr:aldehyde dehydrogenase family protein [Nitrososphaerales archaeon]
MVQKVLNLIGGKWMASESGQTFGRNSPADVTKAIGEFQLSNKDDVKRAVEAAGQAFWGWRNTPGPERGKILYRAAELIERDFEDFAKTMTIEEGKTLTESRSETRRGISILRFFAGQASRLNGKTYRSENQRTFIYTVREPLGIVALMTPWNFPTAIPLWKIAPALASGNTVVFKPASLTPLDASKIVQALEQAGLPPGVLNFITGPGSTIGEALAVSDDVAAISFTGSYEVGHGIHRARANAKKMARIQLEMGGKNPTVVLPDAKLDSAVENVTKAAFGLTGQACTATSRVIVHESIKETFLEKLVTRVKNLKVGDGLQPGVEMGPAVDESQLEKDLEYVRRGREEGARILTGGRRPEQPEMANGYFIEPTIFDNVTSDMRIAQEEIFGPVLSVLTAKNLEDAIEVANNTVFGLSAGLCTTDLTSAHEFADKIQAGIITINRSTVGAEPQIPFGGEKRSSTDTFREQGEEAIDFYTRIKTVYTVY